jgi:hypothetical protein
MAEQHSEAQKGLVQSQRQSENQRGLQTSTMSAEVFVKTRSLLWKEKKTKPSSVALC